MPSRLLLCFTGVAAVAAGLSNRATPTTRQSQDHSRYVVRDVDGVAMLVDLDTGWTWRRIATNAQKPPRWQHVQRFDDAEDAAQWFRENRPAPPDPRIEQTHRWAATILLGPEYEGAERDPPVIRRWTSSPTLSYFGASDVQKKAVEDTVTQLNAVLKGHTSFRVRLLDEANERAAIQVHFVPLAGFPEFARSRGVDFSGRDHATFFSHWDKSHRMTDATVLIASDTIRGNLLKHLVLEEITQTLGPMNDSSAKRDSIFFSGTSATLRLSEEDKQLLRILYRRVRPGDSPRRLRRAIDRYWVYPDREG